MAKQKQQGLKRKADVTRVLSTEQRVNALKGTMDLFQSQLDDAMADLVEAGLTAQVRRPNAEVEVWRTARDEGKEPGYGVRIGGWRMFLDEPPEEAI